MMTDWIKDVRAWWIIGALAALAAFAGVFTLPVTDRDEGRYVQATAQMLETGDFVRINVLDEPRNKKPVGIHWMQAAVVGLVSSAEAREVWAYRLPSVIGAILAALAAFWAGTRLMSREAAFAGAALFAVTVSLGFEAGIAKTDAMLAGLTTLSMAALAHLRAGGAGWKTALIFWVAMGLGILVKGPVTPMVAGLTIIALAIWERKFAWLLPLIRFWPGPILMVLIVLPWLISVQIATEGAFLREALGDDLGGKVTSGDEGHGGPPGYHLFALFLMFFPAVLFLFPGAARVVGAMRDADEAGRAARFLIAWVIPSWLVFEIMPTKLPHYTLPLYPALALAAGWGIMEWAKSKAWERWTGWALFALAGAIFAIGLPGAAAYYGANASPEVFTLSQVAGFLPNYQLGLDPGVLAGVLAVGALFAALYGATLFAQARGAVTAALVLAVLAGLGWHVMARGVAAPSAYALRLSDQVAALREYSEPINGLAPEDIVTVTSFKETSLVFLLGSDTVHANTTDEALIAAEAIEEPVMLVIDTARDRELLNALTGRLNAVSSFWWATQASGGENPVGGLFHYHARLQGLQVCHAGMAPGLNYAGGDETVLLVYFTRCSDEPVSTLEPGSERSDVRVMVRMPPELIDTEEPSDDPQD
jgi:4-amino-4-deoxy-L-arabinose transferase-like glycosyltransferase